MSDLLEGAPRGAQKPSLKFMLNFYDTCLREGTSPTHLGTIYGKSKTQINRWIDNYKPLRVAYEMAKGKREKAAVNTENAKETLSEEAYELWESVQSGAPSKNQLVYMGSALSGRPTKLRQQLFLMAMLSTNYRVAESCRITGVSRQEVQQWKKADPEFIQMFAELTHQQVEDVRGALHDLVKEKNVQAVIYADKKISESGLGSNGTGINDEDIVKFEQLEKHLSVETMRDIYRAMQECGVTSHYVPAEGEVIET